MFAGQNPAGEFLWQTVLNNNPVYGKEKLDGAHYWDVKG